MNATAVAAGLSRTRLNSIIGCFDQTAPNSFTAADATALHAGIHNGTLLSGAARDAFYAAVLTFAPAGPFLDVIKEEGARLRLPDNVVDAFASAASFSSKGGSYSSGPNQTRSDAGRMVFPVQGPAGSNRVWTYALLVDSIEVDGCCWPLNQAMGAALGDVIRPAVRDALQTYVSAYRAAPLPNPSSDPSQPRGSAATTTVPTPAVSPAQPPNLLDCVGRLLDLELRCR